MTHYDKKNGLVYECRYAKDFEFLVGKALILVRILLVESQKPFNLMLFLIVRIARSKF